MPGKNRSVYLFICSMLFFALFLFQAPSFYAASFSDSVSVESGIKLTLGNVNLDEADSDLKPSVTLSSGAPEQTLLTTTLQNSGSLDGKIGYEIEGNIPTDVAADISLALYEGSEFIADLEVGKDGFLKKDGEPVIIEPGNQKTYSVKIKTATLPNASENFLLSISFSLTQTNAIEPKQMFHDEVTFGTSIVVLEAVDSVPGWPVDSDPRWHTDAIAGVRYINEFETEMMYYSETSDGKRIRNLDDVSFYLDFSESNQPLKLNSATSIDSPYAVEMVEVAEGKYRLDISMDTAASGNSDKTTLVDSSYRIVLNNPQNGEGFVLQGSLYAKRLLLSTDTADSLYNTEYQNGRFPLYASKQLRSFRLAYISENYTNQVSYLTESELSLSEYTIGFSIQKKNSMIAGVDEAGNSFTLKVVDGLNKLEDASHLSIFITGSAGNKLKIERTVKALLIDSDMQVPTVWNDLGGQNKIKISSQQLDVQLVEKTKGNRLYYVSDPAAPPMLYLMNTGNSYFDFRFANQLETVNGLHIEKVVYSPDMKIMRITFSFESEALPDGFNFSVSNGINNIISGTYFKFNFIRASQTVANQVNAFSASEILQSTQDSVISEMEPEIEVPAEMIVPAEADQSE